MTVQSKTTLKSYFETGDKPTQAQFIDLIDSLPGPTTIINALDYGCAGNGTTDDTTVAQAGITAATGGIFYFPSGTYKITSALAVPALTHIMFSPNAVIDISSAASSTTAFTATGSEGTAYNLTANSTAAGTSITISTSDLAASGIVANDWIRIASNAVFDSLRTNSKIGEQIQVKSINSGTGVITTWTPLQDTYNTANTAQVSKITHINRVRFSGNGKILGANNGSTQNGIQINLGLGCIIEDVLCEGTDGRGIQLLDSIFCTVSNTRFYNFISTSTGYGVTTTNATQDCIIRGTHSNNIRHIFTTTNSTATRGIPRRILFEDFTCINSAYTVSSTAGDALDTHAAAEDIYLRNGVIMGASNQGINAECRSGSLENIWIYGSGSNGVNVHNETDRVGDWVIRNVHSYNANGNGIIIAPGTSATTSTFENIELDDVSATDCTGVGIYLRGTSSGQIKNVTAKGLKAIRPQSVAAGIYFDNVLYGSLTTSTVIDPTSTVTHAFRMRDSTSITISSNYARLASAATGSAFYVNATGAASSTDLVFAANKMDSPSAVSSRGLLIDNNATNINWGDSNDFRAATTQFSIGTGTGHKGCLQNSATYDPPSLVDGAGTTTSITVTGAALGDFAVASFSNDLQGIIMTAYVQSANSVAVRLQNETTGTLDLASGTLRVKVFKL